MTWHLCYLLGAIVTLSLFVFFVVTSTRNLDTKGEVVTTIVGLTLTLPVVGIVIATTLFWGTN